MSIQNSLRRGKNQVDDASRIGLGTSRYEGHFFHQSIFSGLIGWREITFSFTMEAVIQAGSEKSDSGGRHQL
jgi:hypothetical protein